MAEPRRHMFISGTGRAGTSFLVRFLDGMGLDTHIGRNPQERWHEAANAGLEDNPIGMQSAHLPYVIKTPWLCDFAADVLAMPSIKIDVVLVPVRDLSDAVSSRVVLSQRAIHAAAPWMADLSRSTETWGATPGGVVFSLNPLDQGRLLAVWFHQLVQQLVQADIPVLLLDFPRLAADADYLFAKLQPYLPPTAALEQARAVHAHLADPAKIRVEAERQAEAAAVQPGVAYDAPETLDRIAIRRELTRLRGEMAASAAKATALRASLNEAQAALAAALQAGGERSGGRIAGWLRALRLR